MKKNIIGNFNTTFDKLWMVYAVSLAKQAEIVNEVSVGAVLVLHNKCIGIGHNMSIKLHDPTAHAEVIALRHGGQTLSNYRLLNTTLYVTLEPCAMCIGAIINARVGRLVIGAKNIKLNKSKSIIDMLSYLKIDYHLIFTFGILEDLCSNQLSNFFRKRR